MHCLISYAQPINACFLNPNPIKQKCSSECLSSSHWLHMQDKVQKQLQNFTAPDRFLCGSSPTYESSRSFHHNRPYPIICMRQLNFLQGFVRHWSMETGRVRVSQDFLSLCKIRPSVSTSPVSSLSLCLEKAWKKECGEGGRQGGKVGGCNTYHF